MQHAGDSPMSALTGDEDSTLSPTTVEGFCPDLLCSWANDFRVGILGFRLIFFKLYAYRLSLIFKAKRTDVRIALSILQVCIARNFLHVNLSHQFARTLFLVLHYRCLVLHCIKKTPCIITFVCCYFCILGMGSMHAAI